MSSQGVGKESQLPKEWAGGTQGVLESTQGVNSRSGEEISRTEGVGRWDSRSGESAEDLKTSRSLRCREPGRIHDRGRAHSDDAPDARTSPYMHECTHTDTTKGTPRSSLARVH